MQCEVIGVKAIGGPAAIHDAFLLHRGILLTDKHLALEPHEARGQLRPATTLLRPQTPGCEPLTQR
jgi:hypothetical protein